MTELRGMDKPIRRIIAGGGNIGQRLAKRHREHVAVKLIEHATAAAPNTSPPLEPLHRGAARRRHRRSPARRRGIRGYIFPRPHQRRGGQHHVGLAGQTDGRRRPALINHASLSDLVQGGRIDIAISPAQTSIGQAPRPRPPRRRNRHSHLPPGPPRPSSWSPRRRQTLGDRPPRRELDLPDSATIAAIVRQTGTSRTEYRDLVAYEGACRRSHHGPPRHGDPRRRPRHRLLHQQETVARSKLFQVGWGFF